MKSSRAKSAGPSARQSKPKSKSARPKRRAHSASGSAAGKKPAVGVKTKAPLKSSKPIGKSSGKTVVSSQRRSPAEAAPIQPPANHSPLVACALRALDDMKAVNVKVLDVRGLTDISDTMVIASGNSDRHVRAIAERVVEFAKQSGKRPMGVEGERDGEWVLVDLQDVVVHVMQPRVREFYRLEALWDVTAARREAAGQ
jgi:ribosome-associated protein